MTDLLPVEFATYKYDGDTWHFPFTPKRLDEIKNFRFQENDVVVATYSKAGTTWMKYIAHMILNEGPLTKTVTEAAPYLDFEVVPWEFLTNRPSPRLFVSHVPARLLESEVREGKVRILHVRRNPKDTLVSFYHYYRMNFFLGRFKGTWDEFFQMYKGKTLNGGDIFEYNSGWWVLKDLPNVFSTTFEHMKRNPENTVRDVSKFLGVDLREDRIREIVKETGFDQMKSNPNTSLQEGDKDGKFDYSISHFYRKGEVGDWKNYFSEEQSAYVDEEEMKSKAQNGLTFDYE